MTSGIPDFRVIFNSVPTPLAVVSSDATIVVANRAYGEAVGARLVAVIGESLGAYLPPIVDGADPDDQSALRSSQDRDGNVERFWRVTYIPLGDAGFSIVQLMDVTADVRRERFSQELNADLVRTAAQLQQLLEEAPDAMITVDEQFTIVRVNQLAEQVFGYVRGDMIGQSLSMLLPEQFRSIHDRVGADYIRHPRPRIMATELELYGLRANGEQFPADININPVRTPEGLLVTASIRDISARRRIEVERERTFRRLEDAAAVRGEEYRRALSDYDQLVRHRVANPLTIIKGAALTLESDRAGEASAQLLEFIIDAVERLEHLALAPDPLNAVEEALRAVPQVAEDDLPDGERVSLE